MSNLEVLREISKWSIEAKDEDTSKYFFHFDDVTEIEDGEKNYVIGRKGTGKTAIAVYLHRQKKHDRFSRLLSFKNFPFNSLYNLSDNQYNKPNQYITIWTYVIYHYICSMMAENEFVCSKCDFDLKNAFNFEIEGALARSVSNITSSGYSLSFLGVGGGLNSNKENVEFDFVKANDAMRKFILSKIDNSDYYIIFDELDEDYREILDPDRKDGYFELLISLFKAVQNIRFEFSGSNSSIKPVIFLRDDIFDLCRDVDKNKWLDRAVVLRWDVRQLRQLIAFRLNQALRSQGYEVDLGNSWDNIFSVTYTQQGRRGRILTFNYLTSRTFLRPRDMISYVRECAKVSYSKNELYINNESIKEAATAHSAYMRREVIDELFPVLDDISEVLNILARIRKSIFTRKEFNDRYREFINQNPRHERKITESQVLKLLYHFNVLGTVTSGSHRVFAYDSEVKVLNMDEKLCVHNGLIHSLMIL